MINGLKQSKNLSIPQRLFKAMIIKLFKAKIKLGQGTRAAKTQAIENLIKVSPKELRLKKLMTTLN